MKPPSTEEEDDDDDDDGKRESRAESGVQVNALEEKGNAEVALARGTRLHPPLPPFGGRAHTQPPKRGVCGP